MILQPFDCTSTVNTERLPVIYTTANTCYAYCTTKLDVIHKAPTA